MTLHPFSPQCGCSSCWNTLNAALLEFRDSLVQLSLALTDLQFDCDQDRKERCEQAVQQLLRDISEGHSSRISGGESKPGG
jgi:hypothetical protein